MTYEPLLCKGGLEMKFFWWIQMLWYKSMMDIALRHDEVLDYYKKYIRAKRKLTRSRRRAKKD